MPAWPAVIPTTAGLGVPLYWEAMLRQYAPIAATAIRAPGAISAGS